MKKNISIIIVIITMFIWVPSNVKAVSMQEYRDAVAGVGISAGSNYSEEFYYSYFWGGTVDNPINMKSKTTDVWLKNAKNGIKSSGYKYGSLKSDPGIKGSFKDRFAVYCESFVQLMVHLASNGAVSYPSDYEKIKVSEIKRGDLIHFPNHIAIFIDDANDSSNYTYTVAEASSKISVRVLSNTADYGYRLKESALAKLDYNYVTSSYDFHDRIDDAMPIITNVSVINGTNRIKIQATDYKHYSLADKSDILEPENFGIVYYQVTTNSTTPTVNWNKVTKTSNLTQEVELKKNGTYYIWVKDVGGNIAKKQVNLTTLSFDNTSPSLGKFKYNIYDTAIEAIITGATDDSGIKEYRYYLDNKLIYQGTASSYKFDNLNYNQIYEIYYEVVDNSNNIAKSNVSYIKTGISANKITLESEYIELIENASYVINPVVDIDSNNYVINYQSDNPDVAYVNKSGTVYAVNSGLANISIGVGETIVVLRVKVYKYNIEFMTSTLPPAYNGKNYNISVKTNIETEITLSSGTLPPGLRIENNKIVGTPTTTTLGEYLFTLKATYDNESVEKEFIINVSEKQDAELPSNDHSSSNTDNKNSNNVSSYIIIIGIIVIVGLSAYMLFKLKRKNKL